MKATLILAAAMLASCGSEPATNDSEPTQCLFVAELVERCRPLDDCPAGLTCNVCADCPVHRDCAEADKDGDGCWVDDVLERCLTDDDLTYGNPTCADGT